MLHEVQGRESTTEKEGRFMYNKSVCHRLGNFPIKRTVAVKTVMNFLYAVNKQACLILSVDWLFFFNPDQLCNNN